MRLRSVMVFGIGLAAAAPLAGCQWLQTTFPGPTPKPQQAAVQPPPPPAPPAAQAHASFLQWIRVNFHGPTPKSELAARALPPVPTASLEDDSFLAAALAHTQSQRAFAEMAETKARTPSIVAYAKGVAAERAGLEARIAAAAQAEGVGGDTNHAPRIDDLKPLQGEAFERAYVAAELEDQQNNLDAFTFEAQNGIVPSVKSLAAGEVPRLRMDLTEAGAIVRDIPFEPHNNESYNQPDATLPSR